MRLSEQLAEATLTDWESFLFEGTRYPVGTVRDWKRGGKTVKMKKVGHKEWVPLAKIEKEAVHEMASAEAKLTSLYGKKTAVIDGKELELDPELTSKTLDEHMSIAKDFLGKHDTVLAENLDMLKDLFPEAQVYGRVKTVASALTKLVRKPSHFVSAQESLGAWGDLLAEAEGARKKKGYATARDLDDGGGMRAVFKTVQEVEAAVKKLKTMFGKQCSSKQDEGPCIVSEDDYLGDSNPPNKNYPYRSYHLVIRPQGAEPGGPAPNQEPGPLGRLVSRRIQAQDSRAEGVLRGQQADGQRLRPGCQRLLQDGREREEGDQAQVPRRHPQDVRLSLTGFAS
jgi:ppGpp synthetase/RelA/SpoT-type nucleotidyltranferase